MKIQIEVVGTLLILLAFIHLSFPRKFDWGNDLKNLSLINRQIIQVHTFFIAITVLFMGILCLSSANELISTHLGNKIALGLGAFWTLRLFIQFFGYSSKLWKGKKFETIMHVLFTLLWMYFCFVFYKTYFESLGTE